MCYADIYIDLAYGERGHYADGRGRSPKASYTPEMGNTAFKLSQDALNWFINLSYDIRSELVKLSYAKKIRLPYGCDYSENLMAFFEYFLVTQAGLNNVSLRKRMNYWKNYEKTRWCSRTDFYYVDARRNVAAAVYIKTGGLDSIMENFQEWFIQELAEFQVREKIDAALKTQ